MAGGLDREIALHTRATEHQVRAITDLRKAVQEFTRSLEKGVVAIQELNQIPQENNKIQEQ